MVDNSNNKMNSNNNNNNDDDNSNNNNNNNNDNDNNNADNIKERKTFWVHFLLKFKGYNLIILVLNLWSLCFHVFQIKTFVQQAFGLQAFR